MNVSLVDVDGTGFPNFALMKLAAWHKLNGDSVDWYSPLFSHPERIYASKIFTFTPDFTDYASGDPEPVKGGTGYDFAARLPDEVESMVPDYSIYPDVSFAIGFLSRGCIRKCPWCVVPKKEGLIRRYANIETVAAGRRDVVLMDNNFLALDREFMEEQVERSVRLKLRLDFNQGLDARLVDEETARILARVRWWKYIRFSCDTASIVPAVVNAMKLMRKAGYKGEFFIYFLAVDVQETLDRIMRVVSSDKRVTPFVMPYRALDTDGRIVSEETKRLARWCNRAWIRKSCSFLDYQPGKK